jgi:RHS repeat-associated protein
LDSNSATIKTFSASYDAVGHLITSTNPDAAYTYSYDAVDRVSSIDNTGTVGVPAVKFNYGYDAVGNLLTVNDSINGTNAGITGYSYDLLNRVTKLTQAGTGVQTKRVDMAYNAVNQLTSLSRFSGVNGVVDTSYVYDLNQRLIQLSHKKGASTVANYDYSYDAADKLAATVSSVDGTSNYSYDSTNQLTGASHTAQTNEAYAYDANGNRTSGGTVTGVNNQLLSDGTYAYQYDGEGNRTKRTEISTGKVTEYVWDYRNRLASVLFKDAGGSVSKTIDYIYDGNNQRIGKRIDGAVVERYVIDRNQIALVFDGAGVQTHRYLYGTQIDQVLADETAGSTSWFLADNQGSIRDVVDSNGGLINHVVYDSFGKVQSQSNAGYDLRFGYTGREQDSETGLDYYRARYYDASNGRFISEDPIGFGAGDKNLSRYVQNSPVNWLDPSGLYGQVTNYSRSIGYEENGDITEASILTAYPFGYPVFGFGQPIQARFGPPLRDGNVNIPLLYGLNDSPVSSIRGNQVIVDNVIAEIKYTTIGTPTKPAKPWGGTYGQGAPKGDQSGHIVPNILGGSNEPYNLFSQSKNMNAGGYNQLGVILNNYLTALEKDRLICGGAMPTLRFSADLIHYYDKRETDKSIHQDKILRPNKVETLARFSDGHVVRGEFSNKVNVQSVKGSTWRIF